ncbi:MAG: ubiquitin-like domain-containing protein, partial [Clostridia bacterium]
MLENMKGLLSRAKTFAMRRAVIIPAAIALVAVAIAVSVATLNTFVVHDGDTTVIHRSYASDAVKMLSANGTELNELDMLKVERTDGYRTFDVRIIPASNVDVVADGKSIKTEVRADETVAAALARAGITMNALDTVSPKAHEVVTDGAKIEVTRISVT